MEKGDIGKAIDRQTTRAAERIEKKIRTPLDRARATRKLGDRRLEEMDRRMRETGQ
jgi:plasmid stabilization system protein ParE